jgi:hypothetical protein
MSAHSTGHCGVGAARLVGLIAHQQRDALLSVCSHDAANSNSMAMATRTTRTSHEGYTPEALDSHPTTIKTIPDDAVRMVLSNCWQRWSY